ncbi:preprotein translocase subunit SecG [Candidatus Nomurabacteria bacterium]|nr:preprotein translocase subunit SecG [Candidatus Nomurabacteria bacterium]
MLIDIMNIITILQIIVSIILAIGILLQNTGSGIEGALGGGSSFESVHTTRRGFELFIFNVTIIAGVAFAALGILGILF